MRYWEIIADNPAKLVGLGVELQLQRASDRHCRRTSW